MRALLPLVLLALLAGCVQPDGGDGTTPDTNETGDAGDVAALPPPIEDSRQISGGADPTAFVATPPCEAPSANCQRYPFDVNATAKIQATLTWGIDANDFDLLLYKDGEPVEDGASTGAPPSTEESFDLTLKPGSYELVVVPYAVAQDTYTLSATFSAA